MITTKHQASASDTTGWCSAASDASSAAEACPGAFFAANDNARILARRVDALVGSIDLLTSCGPVHVDDTRATYILAF